MIGISRTTGSMGGRSRDIGCNSGKGMYFGISSGSRIGFTSTTSSCPSEARGGYRNSGRSAGAGARGTLVIS